jgi:hypothetical protein
MSAEVQSASTSLVMGGGGVSGCSKNALECH